MRLCAAGALLSAPLCALARATATALRRPNQKRSSQVRFGSGSPLHGRCVDGISQGYSPTGTAHRHGRLRQDSRRIRPERPSQRVAIDASMTEQLWSWLDEKSRETELSISSSNGSNRTYSRQKHTRPIEYGAKTQQAPHRFTHARTHRAVRCGPSESAAERLQIDRLKGSRTRGKTISVRMSSARHDARIL